MAADAATLVATGLASAAGTAIAGAIGLRFALARFRKERSFERRLAWHENAIRDLVDTANRLIRALNASRNPLLASQRDVAWLAVSEGFAKLLPLQTEAELYASNAAYQAIVSITEDVRVVSKGAELVSRKAPAGGNAAPDPLALYDIVVKLLLHGASRLATDVRKELELEELVRENRLYDDAFVSHLDDLRARGFLGSDSSGSNAPDA